MHSLVVAGFLVALAVAHATIAVYCISSYARRRVEAGLLVFGLLNAALVVHDGGFAMLYGGLASHRLNLLLAEAGRFAAATLLVHFVLDYTRAAPPRWALRALYAVGTFFVIASLLGLLGRRGELREDPRLIFLGLELRDTLAPESALGLVATVTWLAGLLGAGLLLGRAFTRGESEGLSLVGATLLGVVAVYDTLRALGAVRGPPLAPYGYTAFVQGVMMTLLSRFGSLRRQLERRATELNDRSRALTRANEELRATQDELVRKEQLAAVGELAAVIAHEVRNPLAIIANAVATLRRPQIPVSDRDTLLQILDEETLRLNRLVGDLLRYARPVTIQRQLLSMREIAERAMVLTQGHEQVSAELVEASPAEKIWGDGNLLRQVVENLITNALQAMPSGGLLTLTLQDHEQEGVRGVELQIKDTGEGMDTLVRNRALDPFFTTRPAGTGLGLAIVARIIDAHGGQLRIKSAAGAGTVMHVFLPIAGEPKSVRSPRASDPGERISSVPPMPKEIRRAISGSKDRR
ncbi:MAG: ATP-binding protein [Minicystis sp.]